MRPSCLDGRQRSEARLRFNIESAKREAHTGTDSLRHITLSMTTPMVCMAIEVYLQRNIFERRLRTEVKPDCVPSNRRRRSHDYRYLHATYARIRIHPGLPRAAPIVPLIAMSGYAFQIRIGPRCSPSSTIAWLSHVPRATSPRPCRCVSAARFAMVAR